MNDNNINMSAGDSSAYMSKNSDTDRHSIPIPRTLSPKANQRRTISPNASANDISQERSTMKKDKSSKLVDTSDE